MIRFSCVYCGRKIRARSRAGGKKAHCPACGHALTVPLSTRAGRAKSSAAGQEKALAWEGRSNKEIAKLLLKKKPPAPDDGPHAVMRSAANAAASPLLPRYDELTLFVLSAALLMLLAINSESKTELAGAVRYVNDGEILALLGIAAAGMFFSLFGVFFKGSKPDVVKWPMLLFAVLVTAGTGIYGGVCGDQDNAELADDLPGLEYHQRCGASPDAPVGSAGHELHRRQSRAVLAGGCGADLRWRVARFV
jgi:hypothetical protein